MGIANGKEISTKQLCDIMEEAYRRGKAVLPQGKVATYIPELGKADPGALGISLCARDGWHFNIGDTNRRFTIQSISKVISLALALELLGMDKVFERVDMEPSGEAFNSLIDLDLISNHPMNPMINSGAITVANMLLGKMSFEEIQDVFRKVCEDPEMESNETVFRSEMQNLSRNRAIAYLLQSKGILDDRVEETLELYTRLCSLQVTAVSLASMGMTIAMDGKLGNGESVFTCRTMEICKTIMLTCGMYDRSGRFAVKVGLPTKSGVGGGLVSVADNHVGIGIYGPALDDKGNCVAGGPILEYLSRELQIHLFQKNTCVDRMMEQR